MSKKVYLIKSVCKSARKGLVATKIGISKDVDRRRNELQTGNPSPLKITKTFECQKAYDWEQYFHKLYESQWVGGEWFYLKGSDIGNIEYKVKNYEENGIRPKDHLFDRYFPQDSSKTMKRSTSRHNDSSKK